MALRLAKVPRKYLPICESRVSNPLKNLYFRILLKCESTIAKALKSLVLVAKVQPSLTVGKGLRDRSLWLAARQREARP